MALPRPPRAVVFDMDGLLFDTEALYQEAMVFAATEAGVVGAGDLFMRTVGVPSAQCRAILLSHFGESFQVDEFLAAWGRHFWAIAETRLALKPGVVELLDVLDELSVPRAIATSSSQQTVRRHLTAHGLSQRFDAIVAQGDYESGKPAPDPFLEAARRLAAEPCFCLALEDSHNGVRSAASAGMMTIMVPDILKPTEEIRGLCVYVAGDLYEVRELLARTVTGRKGDHI